MKGTEMEAPKQTKMIAPDESKIKMHNPWDNDNDPDLVRDEPVRKEPKPKNVKIRAVRELRIEGKIVMPGKTIYVDEDAAKDFCTVIEGSYAFRGLRPTGDDMPRAKITRAVRVDMEAKTS